MDEHAIISDRIKFYRLMIQSYTCFENYDYEQAQTPLQCILDEFQELFDDLYRDRRNGFLYVYWERIIYYSRRIPKSKKSSIKTFNNYFHSAMFNIAKKHFFYAYSYVNDCITILKNLDSGELK